MTEHDIHFNSPPIRPDPDPTAATTAQLNNAVDQLRREMTARAATVDSRFNAVEKATDLFQLNLTRVPTDVDKAVGHLKELHEKWLLEKFETVQAQLDLRDLTIEQQFKGIENQFAERDVRVIQAATAATTAVNAALQAQKEAVGEQNKSFTLSIDKSEKSTFEQINQQRLLLQTNYGALNDKLVALDTRLTRFEGLGLGTVAAQTALSAQRTDQRGEQATHQMSNSWVLALILGAIGAGGFIMEIIRFASGK